MLYRASARGVHHSNASNKHTQTREHFMGSVIVVVLMESYRVFEWMLVYLFDFYFSVRNFSFPDALAILFALFIDELVLIILNG